MTPNSKRNLVSAFKLAILLRLFLDGVVREMDHFILKIFEGEYARRGPDVAFLIPVGLQNSVL